MRYSVEQARYSRNWTPQYGCQSDRLPDPLAQLFFPLHLDTESSNFLLDCYKTSPCDCCADILKAIMELFMSRTDVIAMLNRGE